MGVCAVVVDDEVEFELGRVAPVESPQEGEELLVPVASVAFTDDGALEEVQRGEERGRPVALVVMGEGARAAPLHGQRRLRPVECLDLALLVDAQDDGLVGRVEIETHDVDELLGEVRVPAQLEAAHPVGRQAMSVPDALDGGRADALRGCHRAAAPLGRSRRGGRDGGLHDGLDALGADRRLATPARCRLGERPGAALGEALAPQDDRGAADPSSPAMRLLAAPSAAIRMMRARTATCCGVFCARSHCSSVLRWSSVIAKGSAAVHMPPPTGSTAYCLGIVRRYTSYHLAHSTLADPSEAQDAVHDAFVAAWQTWDSLRDHSK